jgi:hypothetical protein
VTGAIFFAIYSILIKAVETSIASKLLAPKDPD